MHIWQTFLSIRQPGWYSVRLTSTICISFRQHFCFSLFSLMIKQPKMKWNTSSIAFILFGSAHPLSSVRFCSFQFRFSLLISTCCMYFWMGLIQVFLLQQWNYIILLFSYINAIICRKASGISYPQHSTTWMSIILYVLYILSILMHSKIHIHTYMYNIISFIQSVK